MSAAATAKKIGVPSLVLVINHTGWQRTTLQDMEKKYPARFRIVCLGVKAAISAG